MQVWHHSSCSFQQPSWQLWLALSLKAFSTTDSTVHSLSLSFSQYFVPVSQPFSTFSHRARWHPRPTKCLVRLSEQRLYPVEHLSHCCLVVPLSSVRPAQLRFSHPLWGNALSLFVRRVLCTHSDVGVLEGKPSIDWASLARKRKKSALSLMLAYFF